MSKLKVNILFFLECQEIIYNFIKDQFEVAPEIREIVIPDRLPEDFNIYVNMYEVADWLKVRAFELVNAYNATVDDPEGDEKDNTPIVLKAVSHVEFTVIDGPPMAEQALDLIHKNFKLN